MFSRCCLLCSVSPGLNAGCYVLTARHALLDPDACDPNTEPWNYDIFPDHSPGLNRLCMVFVILLTGGLFRGLSGHSFAVDRSVCYLEELCRPQFLNGLQVSGQHTFRECLAPLVGKIQGEAYPVPFPAVFPRGRSDT